MGVVVSACAPGQIMNGLFVHAAAGYRVRVPPTAWVETTEDGFDRVWAHRARPAVLGVASTCARVPQAPSAWLARHLVLGFHDRVLVEEASREIAGRRGLVTIWDARWKGERVRIAAAVVPGPRCLYDLLYVAPAEVFAAERGAFEDFVASFALLPGPEPLR